MRLFPFVGKADTTILNLPTLVIPTKQSAWRDLRTAVTAQQLMNA